MSFSAAVVSCGAIISNMGKRIKEQLARSQKGFATDGHKFSQIIFFREISVFICAHLWLNFFENPYSQTQFARRRDSSAARPAFVETAFSRERNFLVD